MATLEAASAEEPRASDIFDINTALMETTFQITGPTKVQGEVTSGTVFLLGKVKEDKSSAYYVMISAAHVFEGIHGPIGTINFRWMKDDGSYATAPHQIRLREGDKPLYVKHPEVDVAALYVTMPKAFKHRLLPFDLLATDERLKQYEVHPGDELLCLGYPLFASGDYGYPILRSGKIASYRAEQATQKFALRFPCVQGQ